MGVTSAVMQRMDCASLYNHKTTYRKQHSFAPQTVISKATTYTREHTLAYWTYERTLILNFKILIMNSFIGVVCALPLCWVRGGGCDHMLGRQSCCIPQGWGCNQVNWKSSLDFNWQSSSCTVSYDKSIAFSKVSSQRVWSRAFSSNF